MSLESLPSRSKHPIHQAPNNTEYLRCLPPPRNPRRRRRPRPRHRRHSPRNKYHPNRRRLLLHVSRVGATAARTRPPSVRIRRRPRRLPPRVPPPVPPPARPRARRHALPIPSHPVPSPPPAIRTRDRPRESFHPRRDHRPRRMGTTRSRASLAPRADPRRGSRFAASLPLERLSRAGSIARDATRRDADWRDGGEIETSDFR